MCPFNVSFGRFLNLDHVRGYARYGYSKSEYLYCLDFQKASLEELYKTFAW
jgi:hypothetical protein